MGCILRAISIILFITSTNLVAEEQKTIVMKPSMRPLPLSRELAAIETEPLISYLENIIIFTDKREIEHLPYIVGFDNESTIGGTGDLAYSMGIDPCSTITMFTLIDQSHKLVDPDTNETLGYYADAIGSAKILNWSTPQTLTLTSALTPIEKGTKLIPFVGLNLPSKLEVNRPRSIVSGRILQVDNDRVGVGTYAVAIISIGACDGLRQGDLLDVLEGPSYSIDPETNKSVLLPAQIFGKLLVYKVLERVSLAIVVDADKAVHELDRVFGSPA